MRCFISKLTYAVVKVLLILQCLLSPERIESSIVTT